MLYTIENEHLRVQASSRGAELQSLVRKSDGSEYLWQGDARYWKDRALHLFPIVGRLWGGHYTYRGRQYEMPIHGFVSSSELEVVRHEADAIAFRLRESEATLAVYPFRFELTISHTLAGRSVMTKMEVVNRGEEDLIFTLGGHPGFQVPVGGEGAFTDWYLEFDQPAGAMSIDMSPACFLTDGAQPLPLQNGRILPLRHELFDNDALVLYDVCRAVSLKSEKSARQVRVEFPQMPYLGIWHAPRTEAPYVCIEPWAGLPSYDGRVDDLETKRDMLRLPQGETYENTFVVTIQ